MNYVELINKMNEELSENGIKSIYVLIANNIELDVITNLVEKNTKEYNKLTSKQKDDFVKYIKGLSLQKKLLFNF